MMRFDMRAPGRSAAERAALYRAAIDMAAWSDTRGCVSIAISEHHASEDGYLPSPFPMASALAAVTQNAPIVVAAALLNLYEPMRLAEDIVVLDHLSAGRAMVVLGLGYRAVEYELHGVSFADRAKLADEKLARLLDAFTRVTPKPYSGDRPMIAWGGASKAAARRAGRFGLPFIAQGGDAAVLQPAYEEAAAAAHHAPGMVMIPSLDAPLSVFVHDDPEQGWHEVGDALLADAMSYYDWNIDAGSADVTASLSSARSVDALRAANGSHRVVTVVEARQIISEFGMLSLQPLCGGLDPSLAWTYLRRVTDEVL